MCGPRIYTHEPLHEGQTSVEVSVCYWIQRVSVLHSTAVTHSLITEKKVYTCKSLELLHAPLFFHAYARCCFM